MRSTPTILLALSLGIVPACGQGEQAPVDAATGSVSDAPSRAVFAGESLALGTSAAGGSFRGALMAEPANRGAAGGRSRVSTSAPAPAVERSASPVLGPQPGPFDAILAQLDEEDRELARRVLEARAPGVLTAPEDLARVSTWVEQVRSGHEAVTARREQLRKHLSLAAYVDRKVLFELGLLDSGSFGRAPSEFEWQSEEERLDAGAQELADIIAAGTEAAVAGTGFLRDDYVDPTDVVPQPRPGQIRLVNPRGAGELFWAPRDLDSLPCSTLTADVCHDIVARYVEATGDRDMMQRWTLLDEFGPDPQLSSPGPDLRRIQDRLLDGQLDLPTARALVLRQVEVEDAVQEYVDRLMLAYPVGGLVHDTLTRAHVAMLRAHEQELAADRARDATDLDHPYRYLDAPAAPTKTRAQRRSELERFILDAVSRK